MLTKKTLVLVLPDYFSKGTTTVAKYQTPCRGGCFSSIYSENIGKAAGFMRISVKYEAEKEMGQGSRYQTICG